MKVAHVKTVDGVTQMLTFKNENEELDFEEFLYKQGHQVYTWFEKEDQCFIVKDKIISVRFREVAE